MVARACRLGRDEEECLAGRPQASVASGVQPRTLIVEGTVGDADAGFGVRFAAAFFVVSEADFETRFWICSRLVEEGRAGDQHISATVCSA